MSTPPRRPRSLALPLLIAPTFVLAHCANADRNGAFRELSPESQAPACPDFRVGYDMTVTDFGVDPSVRGPFASFAQAMGDYVAISTKLLDDVTAACRNVALDLGGTESDQELRGRTGEEASYGWCNLAVRKLQRALTDSLQPAGKLSFAFAPSLCTIDEPYLNRCEGACSTDASCTEKPLTQRCDPAHLAGMCPGKCTGTCRGSTLAAVLCDGKCEAQCEGPCDGDCTGMCEGRAWYGGHCRGSCVGICQGGCHGRCSGACTYGKGAAGKCDGPCEGGCSVAVKAPKCEADLKAPACPVSADCEANCKASAQARANCTTPSLVIGANNDFGGSIEVLSQLETLQRNLPLIFSSARTRGPQLEAEAKAAYEAGERMFNENPKLGPKGRTCARTMLSAGEQALENVHVAVQASKSILVTLPIEQ